MHSSTIVDAIVHSRRQELMKIAVDHLRMKGVSNVLTPATITACIEALDRFPKGLLVLDWELGAPQVARLLGHNRRRFDGQLRPIMLVASQVSTEVIAAAAEYGVSQIFTEALTPKNLGARLTALVIAESMPNEIKRVLNDVHDARASGDGKQALAHLQKALKAHPGHVRLKCEAAEALLELGQADKALQLLEGVNLNKPPYLRGIHLYGRCLLKLGRTEEALPVLEQAQLFNPHDAERLVEIGQALLQMDRLREAREAFDHANSVDPDFRPARAGQGQCLLMDGQVNEALGVLKEVANVHEIASLFNTCAVLNMRRGRHEAGMHLYQSALGALGKDERLQARLYFNMGLGYRRWSKKDKARQCFETSSRLDPSFAKAKEQMTALDEKMRQPDAAATDEATTDPSELAVYGSDLDSLFGDDAEESLFGQPPPSRKKPA